MEVIAYAVGALGLGYGAWSYYHLRRWNKECRGTRVAIAYKGKVKIDAPLVEWLLWARAAAKDKERKGPARAVYKLGGTTVMVVQRVKARTVWKMKLDRWRQGRKTGGSGSRARSTAGPTPTSTPSRSMVSQPAKAPSTSSSAGTASPGTDAGS